MWYDITAFKKLDGYRLELEFENGRKGVVDLSSYAQRGGVFARFVDMGYFNSVSLNPELGVLCWPGDVDIAPETIYEAAMVAEKDEPYGKKNGNVVEEEKQLEH